MTAFTVLVYRKGRNPAIIDVQADDAAHAAFEGWRRFYSPPTVDGRTLPPVVNAEGEHFVVNGVAVSILG